jgi:hypothetical protein
MSPSPPPSKRIPSPSSTRSGRRFRSMAADDSVLPDLRSPQDFPPLRASDRSPSVPFSRPAPNEATADASCSTDVASTSFFSGAPLSLPKSGSIVSNDVISGCVLGEQVLGALVRDSDLHGLEGFDNGKVDSVVPVRCTSSVCYNAAVDCSTPCVCYNASVGTGTIISVKSSAPLMCDATPVLPSVLVCPGPSLACPKAGNASGSLQSIVNVVDVPANKDIMHTVSSPVNAQCPKPDVSSVVVGCRPAAPCPAIPKTWSSLFKSMPCNAGVYEPVEFDIVEENGVMIPPPCVMQAGLDFWSGYVVGFFLDPNHRLHDAAAVCRRAWRLQGGLKVKMVDSLYYLLFSSAEERCRVLESEPSFFDGQPFIITPWSPTVASVRDQVFSIPVWVYFSQIPSALQPLLGLNWLACNIGKLKCFDSNTVARDRLVYAKALIEISPDKPLPTSIPVQLAVGHVVDVRVRYGWVPDICSTCHSFGHIASACVRSVDPYAAPKIPLPRPPLRKWVPKASSVATASGPSLSLVSPASPDPGDVPSVLPAIPDFSLPHVVWAESEHSWVDLRSDMRFNPVDDTYFRYISDDLLDLRCLYYCISGDSLVLDIDGKFAEINATLLADSAWDRSYVYSSDTDCYDPSLAVLFRPFFGLLGGGSSVVGKGDGDSSSAEEN